MKLIKYLFVCCALLLSCQKDSSTEYVQETEGISLEEAKSFFNEQEAQKKVQGSTFALEPLWETFTQGGENNNGELFAYADVVVNEKFDAKLVFAKKAESLRSIVSFSPKSKKTLVISDQMGTIQEIYYIKKDSSLNVMTKMSNSLQLSASYKSSCPRNNCDGTECEKKYCSCECHSNNGDSRPTTDHISNIDPETGQYMGGGGFADIYLSEVVVVGNRNKNRGGSSYLPIYNNPSPDRFLNNFGYSPYKNGSLFDMNEIDKGGGGGGSSSNTKADDRIDHKLEDYPCAKEILEKLPNLKNDIAKLLKETFETNDKYDIIFVGDNSLIGNNIDGMASQFKEIGDRKVATISLNPDILKTATKEYILVTMYHEVIHTYLNFEKEELGKVEFEKKYPNIYMHHTQGIYNGKTYSKLQFLVHNPRKSEDHHFKFERYINKLTNSILSFNPKMPRETAQAMAKVGIIKGSELYDWEKQLNQNERKGQNHQGQKCN